MARPKTEVKNEQVLHAVMTSKNLAEAAQKLGMSRSGLWNRTQTKEYQELQAQTRSEALQATVDTLRNVLPDAVQTIYSVMKADDTSPQVRINAAQALLVHGLKYIEAHELEARMEALEARLDSEHDD